MNSQRRTTTLVVAAVTVLFAGSATAQQAAVFEYKEAPAQAVFEYKEQPAASPIIEFQEQAGVYEIRATPRQRSVVEVSPSGSIFYRSREGGLAGRVLSNAEDLELTESQEDTIRDMQRDYRRGKIRRDADMEIAELELEEMMEADTPDLGTIENHMRQIANLGVDARMANLRLDQEVKGVLTAEQIEQVDDMAMNFEFRTLMRRNQ